MQKAQNLIILSTSFLLFMQKAKSTAIKYINFQKSILNISHDTYEEVKSSILSSEYLLTPEKIDEFLHLFIECIDKRPRNISFYINLTQDILSNNDFFLKILKEFLLSVNDRKSSRIFYLFLLYNQLKLVDIDDILTFIQSLFKDKAYQYMRIHRKLTLSLFCWFAPEIKEKLEKQNQLDTFSSYVKLLKEAHNSPYFKTLTDINLNFFNDFDMLSANNWEKLKTYRLNGMSYDPIAVSISKDSVDDFVQAIKTRSKGGKENFNGTIAPSIFECCTFLNHHPTYLQYAAFHGSLNIFSYLTKTGADRSILDSKKRRVEDYAIAGGNRSIIEMTFDLYFKEMPINNHSNEQKTQKHENNASHGAGGRRKRNNPFEVGAERTFTSCSNRIQRKFQQAPNQRQKWRQNEDDDDVNDSNDESNSPLYMSNNDNDNNSPLDRSNNNELNDESNSPLFSNEKVNNSDRFYSNYTVSKFNRFGLISPSADESSFFEACKTDCLEMVVFCLDNKIDINSIDKNGTPAVSIACQYGNAEVVKYMSTLKSDSQKIDLSAQDQTGAPPIVRAASFGQLSVVRFLASRSTPDSVCDVDINGSDERGTTALVYASMKGYLRIVDFLIRQRNVDLNAMDEYYGPSFVHAAMHGHLDVIKLLATKENSGLTMRGDYVSFAIIYAANRGYIDVIKYLLTKEGVDLNLRNIYDESVLTSAATGKQLETIKFLVNLNGIDLNQKGPNGNSALLAAAVVGDLDIVKFLCSIDGVDINLLNNYDANALDLAIANKHLDIADYLRSLGLKRNKEE